MNIAIIGTGNVGGALATNWSTKGHRLFLGVNDSNNFKGKDLLQNANTSVHTIKEAVAKADVVLIAAPSTSIFNITEQMGDVTHKVIIDATNSVRAQPEPYPTAYHCLVDKTKAEVVKCFNTTGFENMLNPVYNGQGIDMFMAGDSPKAKEIAKQLALNAGFGACIDFGKADKVVLQEQLALAWINLAVMQGQGRNIAFKLVRR